MSKGAGTTKTVSTTGMPSMQLPYVEELFSRAKGQMETPMTFFPGSTVAPFAPAETLAHQYLQSRAGPMAGLAEDSMLPALQFGMGAYDVEKNPYAKAAAEAAIRPVFESLREEAFPAIRAGATLAGGYGGTRQGIAEGLATSKATQQALDTTAQMYSQAYGQGLQTMLSSAGLVPTWQQATAAPGTVLAGVGAQEREMEQARINEEIARHQFGETAPRTALAEYANLIGMPVGGQAVSEVQATSAGGAGQVAGLGLSLLPFIGRLLGWW